MNVLKASICEITCKKTPPYCPYLNPKKDSFMSLSRIKVYDPADAQSFKEQKEQELPLLKYTRNKRKLIILNEIIFKVYSDDMGIQEICKDIQAILSENQSRLLIFDISSYLKYKKAQDMIQNGLKKYTIDQWKGSLNIIMQNCIKELENIESQQELAWLFRMIMDKTKEEEKEEDEEITTLIKGAQT
jgi:hypothetical protein